ncbi:GTP pyrophosphokinase [compost metagenome]
MPTTKKEMTQLGTERLQKQKTFYRGYFIGRGMFQSIRAMEIAMECHTNLRKDGYPEVSHQFEIVGMILQVFEGRVTAKILDCLVAAGFLHDVPEDYAQKYGLADIRNSFAVMTANIVALVTKPDDFKKNHEYRQKYYGGVLSDIYAVFIKCIDRIHNLQSMVAGFSHEKQLDYIEETETYFYPMIKRARMAHPEHYTVLTLLKQQMEMIIRLCQYNIPKELTAVPMSEVASQ